jgi:dimethylaniline monooxygenase (N-oxide forming)
VSWMLGWRELPSQEEMELEAATFNAWTRKRYLEQGKKHSYFIYDYIPVCTSVQYFLHMDQAKNYSKMEKFYADHRDNSTLTH